MTKPIVFLDIESTGTDPVNDRIIEIALCKFEDLSSEKPYETYSTYVNPGRPIPEDVTRECHGITDAMVATAPSFRDISKTIQDFLAGCDIGGFGVNLFDTSILWEEFYRVAIEWDLSGVSVLDAGVIFRKKEPRTLTAALKFYCGEKHEGAHGALADVLASQKVLRTQLETIGYEELAEMSRADLAAYSLLSPRFDLAGKIGIDKDGDPIYLIGNPETRGTKVKDNPGMAEWMLARDFPTQTKQVLRRYLEALYTTEVNSLNLEEGGE